MCGWGEGGVGREVGGPPPPLRGTSPSWGRIVRGCASPCVGGDSGEAAAFPREGGGIPAGRVVCCGV